jgi:hypothetical protein
LRRVAHRYARALHVELRDLQDALRLPAARGRTEAHDPAELEGNALARGG